MGEFKKVNLLEYFNVVSTKQDDKINFIEENIKDKTAYPYVSRSSSNNGVTCYVKYRDNLVNEGGVITLALDGSTGSSFYQHHEFFSGQNIWQLIPKEEYLKTFNPKVALFLITTIRKAVENYTHILSLTKTRLKRVKVFLPLNKDKTIDTDYIEKRMDKLRNIEMIENIPEKRYYN